MSRTGRIVLIVFSCLGAAALLVVAAGAWWWSQHGEDFVLARKQAMEAGEAFGAQARDDECLAEALVRHDACDGFGCHVDNNLFLLSCLEKSTRTEAFCADIPSDDSAVDSARWRVDQCQAQGRTEGYCAELYAQVQAYCAP